MDTKKIIDKVGDEEWKDHRNNMALFPKEVTSYHLEALRIVKKELYALLENLKITSDNPEAGFGVEMALKFVRKEMDSYFNNYLPDENND